MNHPEQLSNDNTSFTETENILEQVVRAWQILKTQQPLVHCITNQVAANYAANVLLAAGASPAMIDNPFEAESFAKISAAISINLGTPTTEQVEAMKIAVRTANINQIPWVLDPVGYGQILAWRSQITNELIQYKPTVIRGNASEIGTLAGFQNTAKGVDSVLDSSEVYSNASVLFEHAECIAISGESDYILSRQYGTIFKINGGSYLQPKITATGCALGALIAAYCGVTTPTFAAISAHVHFAIAGKLAFERAQQVGSFNVAFLDEIFSLTEDKIRQYAEIEILP